MKSSAIIQTKIDGKLILDDIDIPSPKDDQVLLKLFSSGICHSQLHLMHNNKFERPLLLGHEAVGIVTKIGKKVKHLKEGNHAIITWVYRTPRVGRPFIEPTGVKYRGQLCSGNFTWAKDILINSDFVIPISKDHPTDITSIVGCAVLTGAGAVMNTAKVRPGDSVAIYGSGGIGLATIKTASILKADPIIVVDIDDEKLKFAKEFGATHTINSSNLDPVKEIVEMTNGGVDFAFDAIGLKITNEQILPSVRSGGNRADNIGGTAVLIGLPSQNMNLDPGLFVYGQRQFKGSLGAIYPEKDFETFLRWHKEGKFPLEKLVTKRYKLDQMNEACSDLKSGKILGRAIIDL